MKLLVDIGNTRTKFVFEHKRELSEIQIVNNEEVSTLWLDENWLFVSAILISNVSQHSLTELISKWALSNHILCSVIETAKEKFGVKCVYEQANLFGVDRWLALIGSAKLYPHKNLLIVDAGTATTIDVLTSSLEHVGGWILPGIDLMLDSVLKNTTKVHAKKSVLVETTFGTNTTDCVNNACWASTVGYIHYSLSQAKAQGIDIDLILITGGNAKSLVQLINEPIIFEDKLIFYGLLRYLTD
ncbi:MAG: type III pantothenate kinase [Alteromonadaceae bacterium]|nr:type III pantothenate kinase [Alteromonadaceae bacterium]